MALGGDYDGQDCSLARALELVGERWTLLILRDALFGVRRFSDFAAHLDISRAVLSARLAGLVDADLLERVGEEGSHQDYVATDAALALWPAVHALARWGERQAPAAGPRRVFEHAACGRRLDAHGTCPLCHVTPEPADVLTRPGPGADPTVRDDAVSAALRSPRRLLDPLVVR